MELTSCHTTRKSSSGASKSTISLNTEKMMTILVKVKKLSNRLSKKIALLVNLSTMSLLQKLMTLATFPVRNQSRFLNQEPKSFITIFAPKTNVPLMAQLQPNPQATHRFSLMLKFQALLTNGPKLRTVETGFHLSRKDLPDPSCKIEHRS